MGALDGYKVLDFSTLLPGPYATMTLADLGAEVLKVSSRSKYDLVVGWPPVIEGTQVTGAQAWLGRVPLPDTARQGLFQKKQAMTSTICPAPESLTRQEEKREARVSTISRSRTWPADR